MITVADLVAIAAKHGLQQPAVAPTPWTGAASHVYPLGDAVVKVPFDRPDAIQAVRTDAAVAPLPSDPSAKALICWCQVQTRLYPIRNAAPSASLHRQIGRHIEHIRRYARIAGLT